MIAIVALRWNIPLHQVGKWKYSEVLRHFRAWKYEIERIKEDAEASKNG